MTGITEIVSVTSVDLQRFSKHFQMLPKIYEDILTTFENYWSCLKDNTFGVFWFH